MKAIAPTKTDQSPPGRARKCPICGKPTVPENSPFCSRRCAQVDLHRWLSGTYVIPGREDESGTPAEEED
jgi:endogenous inhibitor of DNA gyrase (YacG/DUF329 family)